MVYGALRALCRVVLGLFYRKLEVVGRERVPSRGPLIVAANHQNALVDPMLIIAALPRRLRPVAKAPLFRHPLIAPFLRAIGAIPVHRRQEGGTDPGRNEATFRAAAETLMAGGAILIFPEGLSQPEPALMPLRTGAARMLLAAERAGVTPRVALVPVGLVLHEPGTFRTGRALVVVGEPVYLELGAPTWPPGAHTFEGPGVTPGPSLPPEARQAREELGPGPESDVAVRALTDRLASGLRAVIVDAENRETLRLLALLEAVAVQGEPSDGRRDAAARAAWMRRAMEAYRRLQTTASARAARFRGEVERYAKDLELAGLTPTEPGRRYRAGAVWRFLAREGAALVGGLPLALWGMAAHATPYQLTRLVVGALRPAPDVEATYKIFAGAVLYPLAWVVESWIVWRLGGVPLAVIFAAALLPAAFFALTWRERLARFAREARAFVRLLLDRDLDRRLAERRRALVDEMRDLARLAGSSPPPAG